MAVELTPEEMMAMSEMWGKHYLESLSVEERLAGMKPEERLAGMKPEDIEKYLRELKKTSSNN